MSFTIVGLTHTHTHPNQCLIHSLFQCRFLSCRFNHLISPRSCLIICFPLLIHHLSIPRAVRMIGLLLSKTFCLFFQRIRGESVERYRYTFLSTELQLIQVFQTSFWGVTIKMREVQKSPTRIETDFTSWVSTVGWSWKWLSSATKKSYNWQFNN